MNMQRNMPMNTCLFALCLAAFSILAFAEESPVSPELSTRIANAPQSHPRLFLNDAAMPDLKAKIESDPLLTGIYSHLKSSADMLMNQEPLKREKIGKRLLGVSRSCLQRVSYWSFMYRMTSEDAYLRRAEREMLAVAAFEDWNPSHFLDVAEMTAALAIGYDWLYNGLSPESREIIRTAIIKKGLETSMPGGGWVKTRNNWNQVCHGGLVMGALAVLEDQPQLPGQIISRALLNLPNAMEEYEPDGVYPEGPSYWQYGTTYNVLMIDALESVLGSSFNLASAQGFMKSPDFYLHVAGPDGLYFNFSDCGSKGGMAPAMQWFARRRHDPALLWREKMEIEQFVAQPPDADGGGDRTLPFLLIWAEPNPAVQDPAKLAWKGDGHTPVAMMRTSWKSDAVYAAIKGGSPSANHAHMDVGTFVIDMKGERWACDLGSQNYNSLESRGIDLWNKSQNSERWTVFRLSNYSHNTLVVNNALQHVAGKAPITRFSDDPAQPFAIIDMTSVYEGQLARAIRGMKMINSAVLIQDEITAPDQPASVRWGMVTQASVVCENSRHATLTQNGKTITLRVLAPENATLTVRDIEPPVHDYDAPNPNTRMIQFEGEAAPKTAATWAVIMDPGETPDPAITPTDAW